MSSWNQLKQSAAPKFLRQLPVAPPPSVMDEYELDHAPAPPELEPGLSGPTVDPFGLISLDPTDYIGPKALTKAGMMAAALGGSIKSAGKKAVRPLRYDPASPQALIPGVEPVTATALRDRLGDKISKLYEKLNFDADNSRFEYRPGPQNEHSWRITPPTGDQTSHTFTPGGETNLTRLIGEAPTPYPDVTERVPAASGGWPFTLEHTTMPDSALSSVFGGIEGQSEALRRVRNLEDVQGRYAALNRPVTAEEATAQEAITQALRAKRDPSMTPNDRYNLESDINASKRDTPVVLSGNDWIPTPGLPGWFRAADDPQHRGLGMNDIPVANEAEREQLLNSTNRLLQQRRMTADALRDRTAFKEGFDSPEAAPIDPPTWAQQLVMTPTDRGIGTPQGREWWNKQLGIQEAVPYKGDPNAMDANVVETFYHGMRDNPAAFQYGTRADHQGARSLEGMADSFGRIAGERINVNRKGGEPDYDADPDFEYVTHYRGDKMKNESGEWKKDPVTHSEGDYPVYDDYGDKKTVELAGVKPTGEPLLPVPYKAQGGEMKLDENGNQVWDYETARGGEIKRDRHGDPIVDEDSYVYPETEGNDVELSVPGKGRLDISGYASDEPMSVGAMGGGRGKGSGELLYQVLMSDALRSGQEIGGTSLTGINQLRLLANANSNYARWGGNPRDLSGTTSPAMTPEMREDLSNRWYNEITGPQMWRAETAVTKNRLGNNRDRVLFDGTQFSIDGKPASPDDIKANIKELSPIVESTGVGQKSIMRAAVFDWLRNATVEDAESAAKNWNKIGSPLFGKATPEFLATVAATGAAGAALVKALQNEKETQ